MTAEAGVKNTNVELDEKPNGETEDGETEAEGLTPEDLERMHNAYNYWHTHGVPEKAAVLFECIQQKRLPPANLIPSVHGIKPETAVDPGRLTVPARAGKDATVALWREFAKATLDMDHEIIDTLQRKDLIKILEDREIIPVEE